VEAAALRGPADADPRRGGGGDSLAYVIYTSGSTGVPKGVAVPHRAVVRLVRNTDYVRLDPSCGMAQVSNSSFDAATFEVWGALLQGGCLFGIPREVALAPQELAAEIRRLGVRTMFLTTALFNQIAAVEPRAFAGVHDLLFGGEAVNPEPVRRILETAPPARLLHVYGPTENTTFSTWHPIREVAAGARTIPIGRPVANTSMQVLDAGMRPVPPGTPGELYLGGDGLARGYLNRPELTAERFVPDPLKAGGRLYRTGDLVRQLPGGGVEFAGRIDHQVKVRGFRVELGEVETLLRRQPGVREAVVLAREDAPGDRRLVAYASLQPGRTVSAGELRRALQESLPDYMVPGALLLLEEMPLTANGKIDRRALPAPEAAAPADRPFSAPRTEVEERLAEIWSELLRVRQVGRDDNFFELGGDSILSIQIVARARQAGIRLSARQMFEQQTVAGLAAVAEVEAAAGQEPPPREGALAPGLLTRLAGGGAVEDAYALSPMQQGLLFHSLYAEGPQAYLEQLSCTLEGELDEPSFLQAWRRVVQRHPALRTGFAWEELDEPLQVVRASVELPVLQEDWRGVPEGALPHRLRRHLEEDRARAFDLGRPPLLRLALIRLADRRWRFVWSFHHLLFDGWCIAPLLREVLAFYEAARRGGEAVLAQPRPYRDHIAWLALQDPAAAERFWRATLAGFTAPNRLQPDAPGARGGEAEQRLRLSAGDTEALHELAQASRLTLNTLVQGAWALLVARYSSQTDVVFGAVVSGRPAELDGVESMIGLFINTVPVRVACEEGFPAASWLASLQRGQAEARQFEHSPLVRVQGWSEVEAGEPLFESLLVFENYPVGEALAEGESALAVRDVDVFERTNYPLTLKVAPGRALSLSLGHDGRYEVTTVRRMLGHLETALRELAADPARPPRERVLLAPSERHQLLVEWNDTGRDGGERLPVHERFAAQASRFAGEPALIFGGEVLTYGRLNARADRLAHHLRALGVGPEEPVGVCLERSVDLVVALLAVLKAGGVFLPLDPSYPAERLAFMMADSLAARPASVVVTRGPLADRFAPLFPAGTRAVRLDLEELPTGGDAPPPSSSPGDLAYLIYTSGTTGRPKAVMVEHGSLANVLAASRRELGFAAGDAMACLAPFSFDIFLFELLNPLLVGGTCHLFDFQAAPDLDRLLASLGALSRLHAVPALMRQIVDAVRRDRPEADPYPGLRTLFVGGDAVPASLLADLRQVFPGAEIRVLYGPTEGTIICSSFRVPAGGEVPRAAIGRPLDGMGLRLLDPAGRPVPLGVAGEIAISGRGVARGYLNRPELTAERFIPDPAAVGGRLYRTGDLARQLAEGGLEFLGRVDHQVKVRGFRIELGEVEAVLRRQPGVGEAVVLIREDAPGDRRLVAYATAAPAATLSPGELRRALRESLPDYMVPSAIVPLAELPLTANGKIDRRALPAPEAAGGAERPFSPPQTEVERRLAEVWSELLRARQVGRDDNFFELGGDSILSIQIVARARQAGIRLSPRQLFEHPTVAGLALVAQVDPARIEEELTAGPVPLTPIQRWFFDPEPPEPHHFNQALLLEVRRELDPAVLGRALAHLARHHDALRLRFAREDGPWRQAQAPADEGESFPLAVLDLSTLPGEAGSRGIEAAADALQTSLDLGRGPLARAALFVLGEGRPARLLVVVHHLLVDGVSWRILLEDIATVHGQLAAGRPAALPARTTSYQRWARTLDGHSRSGAARRELGFWLERGARETPALPVDLTGGGDVMALSRVVSAALTEAETRALLTEARQAYRTQINDLLLTALARALMAWSGQPRSRVHLEGHGREEIFEGIDLTRTVGWFTSIYPVVLDLGGAAGPGDAIKAVKEQLRAVPDGGIGYGLLRFGEDGESAALLAAQPRAEISFNYLGQLDQALDGSSPFAPARESAGRSHSPRMRRSHAIEVNGAVSGGRLRMDWSYSAGRHRRESVAALAERFVAELRELLAHCLSPQVGGFTPSDFPLARLDQPSLDRLLGHDRRVEDVYPLSPMQQGLLFHSLYAEGRQAYFEQLACTLEGDFDAEAFARAWQRVVERHPALRAGFVWEDLAAPLQVVHRGVELPVAREDWRGLPADEQERRLRRHALADRARGFDLTRPCLMRIALIRLAERRWRFLWSFHHLLFDGWCFSILFNDVFAHYAAELRGGEPALTQPRPYRDYIAWLARQDRAAAERFWRDTLAGFTAPNRLEPAAPAAGDRGGEEEIRLTPEVTAGLQEAAQRYRLTLNTVVQGAWALLVARSSGVPDVVFGTVVSGRPAELPGAESMVGLFINTLPLRAVVDPGAPLDAWLHDLQRRQAEMRTFEHSPLVEVQGWSEVPAGEALFQTLLIFENYPVDESLGRSAAGFTVADLEVFDETNYPLTLTVGPARGLWLRLSHDGRFEAATVRRMLGHLGTLLEGLAAGLDRTASDVPFLTPAERQQILVDWSAGERRAPVGAPLHRLFEARAAASPNAVAVTCGVEHLTYGELNRRANRLARRLQDRGVAPGSLVAICLERSPELAVALMAVLKAGGAYLPIDPASPTARLAFLLEDAGRPVLVTRRSLEERLPAGAGPRLLVDEPAAASGGGDLAVEVPGARRQPRLRDLHLRLHRPAQGRGGAARERGAAVRRHRTRVRFRSGGRLDALPLVRLRFLRLGDLGRPAPRRPSGGGAPRGQPLARGLLRPPLPRGGHRPQPDAVGLPPARAG